MRISPRIRAGLQSALAWLTARLSGPDALVLPALLGLLAGIVSGLVMVGFRLVIERSPIHLLHLPNAEAFEGLAPHMRFLLPVAGGLLVGILFQYLQPTTRPVGVVHVLERLTYHDGQFPIRNALAQFAGASISLISGHSAGREGPAIHIGAASASWMGQHFGLPNNSLRVLAGCGTAGAIAASFNTPLAGVLFALEVILTEFTLNSLAPIIMAAVGATAVSRLVFGNESEFQVNLLLSGEPSQLIYALLIGICIGLLASALVRGVGFFSGQLRAVPVWIRLTLAGGCTGVLAVFAPEIMGVGYDTVNTVLIGGVVTSGLVLILATKMLATAAGLGLGLPGGIIGPTLFIGAIAGSLASSIHDLTGLGSPQATALYPALGMVSMMGATLHAPLAALTALLELTSNQDVIFPGMLAVISAYLTSKAVMRTESVFDALAHARGIELNSDPLSRSLRRLAVPRAMTSNFVRAPRIPTRESLTTLLDEQPQWIVVDAGDGSFKLLPAAELARLLEVSEQSELDLIELPLQRHTMQPIPVRSTLAEALRRMDAAGIEALYVVGSATDERILGIVTRNDVARCYRI
jgi:H+/Cl- antiporter ClcA